MIYKVGVVDDSAFMRSELTKIIEKDPKMQVVATAEDGSQALELVRTHCPDVLTLDINMPVMNGIEALEQVMTEAPLPVVMISTLTFEGAEETLDALEYGAFDFFHKPSGSISLDISEQGGMIREKLKQAASSKIIRKPQNKTWDRLTHKVSRITKLHHAINIPRKARLTPEGKIVAIGVSTGGPRTLSSILPKIPGNFDGSILIAQHMPEKFTLSFSNRLNNICQLRVKEARDGDIIQAGRIYIAPGGKNIRVKRKNRSFFNIETMVNKGMSVSSPSVDVLFRSLMECSGNRWLGVMLTGMGSDGAKALAEHRSKGGCTIVESEQSCVVYGMPGKVVELEGAEFILDEDKIAEKIVELIGNSVCH